MGTVKIAGTVEGLIKPWGMIYAKRVGIMVVDQRGGSIARGERTKIGEGRLLRMRRSSTSI